MKRPRPRRMVSPRATPPHPLPFRFEPLEERQLLAFGTFPYLDGQVAALNNFPQYNGSGQTIAILDTGVDYNHPALSGKMLDGYDFVDNDPDPIDPDGHGTGVAGIAVASQFSYGGAQYQGIAPGANIVALRTDDGSVDAQSTAGYIEQGLQWVIAHRVQYNITVVNISTGYGHFASKATQAPYGDELATLAAAGVFIVAASGNDGVQRTPGVEYPSADPSVYSAGSINSSDAISTFTERGPIMDFLAPGENVPIPTIDGGGNPVYVLGTGTSFSSPAIAGAAAILKQVDPNFTPDEIASILAASGADKYDAPTATTYPRLNLDAAIRLALLRAGQTSAESVSPHGKDSSVAYDAYGILHEAWFDSSDGHLKYATRNANGVWSGVQTVDAGTNVGYYCSLALDATGTPGIAYYDARNADLKYAVLSTSGTWTVKTLDSSGVVGYYPSLAYTTTGTAYITYYYKSGGDLRVATVVGSKVSIGTIDSGGDVGRYSSLKISPAGTLMVAYEDTGHGWFKFASKGSSSWSTSVIDAKTKNGGGYISLNFTSAGRPAFSYYDAYHAALKYAVYNGSSWSAGQVSSGAKAGLYSNLVFDANGSADILYYDKTNDQVLRAQGGPGSWTFNSVVTGGGRNMSAALSPDDVLTFSWFEAATDNLRMSEL